eukprot:GILJ01003788.1.p1 GENE.GILJ01003788.1~~GILJ01003788.1.p1  ORF type:complete len:242 (-),score=18.69 GILJ01003788.1:78-803(-)
MNGAIQNTEARAAPIAPGPGSTPVQSVWFKPAMKALVLPLMLTLATLVVSFALDDWGYGFNPMGFGLKLFHPVLSATSPSYSANYYAYLDSRCSRGACSYSTMDSSASLDVGMCQMLWRLFHVFLARAAGGLSLMVVLGYATLVFSSVTIRSNDTTTLRKYGTLCVQLLSLASIFAVGFTFSELALPQTKRFETGLSFKIFIGGTCGVVFCTICLWALLLSTRQNSSSIFQEDMPQKNEGK